MNRHEEGEDRRFILRNVDVGFVLNLLVLSGMVWAWFSYPTKWNQAVADVALMKPEVAAHSQKLAVINAQYEDIKEELRAINRKLGR